jgi:hypothetical protein
MLFQNVKIRKKGEKHNSIFQNSIFVRLYLYFFVITFSFALSACRTTQKTDMRTLAPSDAIIYLETNDLAETLQTLTESQAFQELAADQPDFSALKNMQLAVAVTGFETSEKKITEENSLLNFKPQFVAVAETHAWSWQTLSFAENQLNNFVMKNYGVYAKLERRDKADGKLFTWTASDGRKTFAYVENSLIYFGNDWSAIEKCLAVKKGEAESLAKNDALTRAYSENNLAFGYLSSAGIAQIANLVGVSLAVDTTEESDARSLIARIVPQILQNTTEEIVWTANKTERGIEDNFSVSLTMETSSVIKETLATSFDSQTNSAEFLPPDFLTATHYNLKNPLIAWRSLLLLTAKNTDALSGKLLIQFSDALLEPYGVSNAETFLSSIDSEILTVRFDEDGDRSVSIVSVKDLEKLKSSITKEINFNAPFEKRENAEMWFSENKQLAALFIENKLLLGDGESVLKCLQAKRSGQNFTKSPKFQRFVENQAVAVTFGRDADSATKIVEVIGKKKGENKKLATFYSTETSFTEKGFKRKNVSDFGLIGTILQQIPE